MKKTLLILLFFSLILTGCLKNQPTADNNNLENPPVNVVPSRRSYTPEQLKAARAEAMVKCQDTCEVLAQTKTSENISPICLSEEIIEDWACFIVNYPRDIGVIPGEDCASLQDGRAGHYIELSTDCSVLRAN